MRAHPNDKGSSQLSAARSREEMSLFSTYQGWLGSKPAPSCLQADISIEKKTLSLSFAAVRWTGKKDPPLVVSLSLPSRGLSRRERLKLWLLLLDAD